MDPEASSRNGWAGIAVAVSSGLLLAGAYPPLGWSALAWLALAPLLWAVRGLPPRRAAGLGFASGAVFWHLSLAWMQRVTTAGWIALSLYCALYTAAFAALYAAWHGTRGADDGRLSGSAATALAAAVAWTGLEYMRSVLLTGFPWNGLGVSQYRNTILIQSASWGGVFAVSALLAWVNTCLALALERRLRVRDRSLRPGPEIRLAAAAVLAALAQGAVSLARLPAPTRTVRLALVQPAIPQYEKWTDAFIAETHRRLESLSAAALTARPDLLVWPETAIADVLRASPEGYALVTRVTQSGTPLLLGALDDERGDDGTARFFNSAFLIGSGGSFEAVYDKRHLVLFGEYIPFGDRFPWLRSLSPIESDVTPGRKPGLFPWLGAEGMFGVLICFEDTVPGLARDLAAGGANLFITLTNDAWFDPSSGSMQHLAQSVFRSVEQRRPTARCANSGITAWIDAAGRIGHPGMLPHYGPGRAVLSGYLLAEIPLHDPPPPRTLHARFGDLFGRACAWALLPLAALLFFRRRAARRAPPA